MYDIIIKNGSIHDGSLNEAYTADLAIKDGKIVKIAPNIEESTKETLDASKRIVSPGFIDSHSHTDLSATFYPSNYQKLEQGVTSEAVGMCGETLFPVNGNDYENTNKNMSLVLPKSDKFDPEYFTSTKRWIKHLEKLELGTNMVNFVGHGSIRANIMGFAARTSTEKELHAMQELLIEALESGVKGLSSGLAYAPGVFSDKAELTALCHTVAKYKGVHSIHMRNQGADLLKSVQESIDIAKETGCTTVISHLKSIGKPNWGKVQDVVNLINQARSEGIDIYCDAYPYLAGSTTIKITLPPSLLEGGEDAICQRLASPEGREYVTNQIKNPTEHWENAIGNNGFNSIVVIEAPATPAAEGKGIEDYAKEIGKDPFTAYFDLIVENHAKVKTLNFVMSEADLMSALSCDYCMIGSDGYTNPKCANLVHPRSVGTFPKFFGEYVRDKKMMSWVKAINKCTNLPAQAYGLKNKGTLKEGYDADIVIFNPETINATSDFIKCYDGNIGIDYVICGGVISVKDNAYTGQTGGGLILA